MVQFFNSKDITVINQEEAKAQQEKDNKELLMNDLVESKLAVFRAETMSKQLMEELIALKMQVVTGVTAETVETTNTDTIEEVTE